MCFNVNFFPNISDPTESILHLAPTSGNMLGGTIVNITGPCFDKQISVKCIFNMISVPGIIIDRNRAVCVQPFLSVQGYIDVDIILGDNEHKKWTEKYFVETPETATEKIWFNSKDVYTKSPFEIKIMWEYGNLTSNLNANVQISLWGYQSKNNVYVFLTLSFYFLPLYIHPFIVL